MHACRDCTSASWATCACANAWPVRGHAAVHSWESCTPGTWQQWWDGVCKHCMYATASSVSVARTSPYRLTRVCTVWRQDLMRLGDHKIPADPLAGMMFQVRTCVCGSVHVSGPEGILLCWYIRSPGSKTVCRAGCG